MTYVLWYYSDEISDKSFYRVINLPFGVAAGQKLVIGHTWLTVENIIYECGLKWTVIQVQPGERFPNNIEKVLKKFEFEEAEDLRSYLLSKDLIMEVTPDVEGV